MSIEHRASNADGNNSETCINLSQVGARQFKIQQHASRQLLGWYTGCRSDNGNHLMQPEFEASLCMTPGLCTCVSICKTFSNCSYRQVSCDTLDSGVDSEAFLHG